jgi:hypothetical protein
MPSAPTEMKSDTMETASGMRVTVDRLTDEWASTGRDRPISGYVPGASSVAGMPSTVVTYSRS